jgi:HlyD family type I secretion membrane fusion protein
MTTDSNTSPLRPVQSDEFLPPISLWTTIGGFVLLGTVGLAFILAGVVKYNVKVRANATVRPAGEIRIVQAATPGPIKTILVKENQPVKRGDAIAEIDDAQLQIKRNKLKGDIQRSQQQLDRIKAQLEATEKQRQSEANLINRSVASAEAELERTQREFQQDRVKTKTELQEAQAAFNLVKEELNQYQQYFYTGSVNSELTLKQKQEAVQAAKARLERAKAAFNPTKAPVTIAREEIAKEKARGESNMASLRKEKESLLRSQVETQNQISSDLQELKQIETDLQKAVIRAPESGVILKLTLRNPGQLVDPGQEIAQIAPSGVPMTIKARVAVQDISQVQICSQELVTDCKQGRVQLQISAYPYPDYGTLSGAVRTIAPDAITSSNGSSAIDGTYYEVTIQPEKPYLVKGDRQYPIQPGMEVTANIVSREETFLSFILRKARLLTSL